MPSAYKLLPRYTYEDYCRWQGRWELIEGIAYDMSPMPRPEHQAIATNLAAEFRAALKVSDCTCKVYQPLDYKIADDTILNPDLLLVCKPIQKAFLDFAPELVVEILSPATALKDRHTKYEIYQDQKIQYYLIVDADIRDVEVYRLSESSVYERVAIDPNKPFQFHFPKCNFEITFENIWS
jgi:Uma2 family endonuclease